METSVGFRAEEGANKGHQLSSRALGMDHQARFKGKFEVMVKAEATETALGHLG